MSQNYEIIASSSTPGVMEDLLWAVKKFFQLPEDALVLETGRDDRILLDLDYMENNYQGINQENISQLKFYCSGFLDGIDASDYVTTEYLNDR